MEILILFLCVILYFVVGSLIVMVKEKITGRSIDTDFAVFETFIWPAMIMIVYIPTAVYKCTRKAVNYAYQKFML